MAIAKIYYFVFFWYKLSRKLLTQQSVHSISIPGVPNVPGVPSVPGVPGVPGPIVQLVFGVNGPERC